ncbi:MAG: hypothetical protein PSX80_07675 [bacterium]|nr:hypothetical protein [bacterium]
MKLRVLVFWLVCFSVSGSAETVYDQPYLGEFPEHLRGRFAASAWGKNAGAELTSIV